MDTRREVLRGGLFFAGSVLVIGAAPDSAEAGFFDDIGGAMLQGLGYAADGLVGAAKEVVNVAGDAAVVAQPIMKVLAATPMGMDPRFAAANAATQVAADIKKGMQNGPVQAAPIIANATERPVAMPVTVQRAQRPMPVRSSMDDEMRRDPYGFMQRNYEMIDDYLEGEDLQFESSNYVLRPRRISGIPILTDRFPQRGYYPSRVQYVDRSGRGWGLPPMQSMVYAGDYGWG